MAGSCGKDVGLTGKLAHDKAFLTEMMAPLVYN